MFGMCKVKSPRRARLAILPPPERYGTEQQHTRTASLIRQRHAARDSVAHVRRSHIARRNGGQDVFPKRLVQFFGLFPIRVLGNEVFKPLLNESFER
jgi:hypothetical protein